MIGRKNATLKDIASEAGVSVCAVSKALQDYDDISDELKAKVRGIAKDLDYQPNLLARAFRTKRTYNIGTIYRYEASSVLTHAFFSNVLNAFCNELVKNGYDLTYVSSRIGQTKSTFVKHCEMKGFEGLLLACVDFQDSAISELAESGIPFVSIDHLFGSGVCVTSDNYSGMMLMMDYCFSQGHRDICFIHGQDNYVTNARKKAFEQIMGEKGIAVDKHNMIEGEYYSFERTVKLFDEILDRANRPTCVLFPDDYCAAVALQHAQKRGVSVPDDISIAGFDNSDFSPLLSRRLATVEQDAKQMGKIAAKSLLSLILGKETEKEIIVPVKLIKGESIGKI